MKICNHPTELLRSAIGPKSGVLCGLCGQDVPSPLVFAALLREIAQLRADNDALVRALPERSRCSRCRELAPAQNTHTIAQRTMCFGCFGSWLDGDDDDCETAIPERARPAFARWLAQMRLAKDAAKTTSKAIEAFPWLAATMRAVCR